MYTIMSILQIQILEILECFVSVKSYGYLWNWDLNILYHKVIINFFLAYVALIYILTCHF